MQTQDMIKATGALRLVLSKADGTSEEFDFKNLVVTVGKEFVASRMVGTASNVMSHMALGSGTTAPVAGNTTLGTELGRVALAGAVAASNVVTYTATFSAGTATGAVTEAGIFNAASAGTMLCRTVFSVVNKGVDDALSVTWTITIS
jgi:hypothetical protein